jgi:hypothetical protein
MRAAGCSTAKFDVSAATASVEDAVELDDGKYDDFIRHRVEVDRVRKASHERAACLALDARVCERGLEDTGKSHIDLLRKGASKPRPLFLIPGTGVQ